MKTHDADSVQVIRCKDCMYGAPIGYDGVLLCFLNVNCMHFVHDDDYCSFAKKSDGVEKHENDDLP